MTVFDTTGPWDSAGTFDSFPASLGFRLEEETALKAKLSGLTVPNANGAPIKVDVWWTLPQRELRTVTYPYIILSYLGVALRREEEHRGYALVTGFEADTGNELPVGSTGVLEQYPIPVYLRYQVAVASRSNVHDVLLLQRLLQPDMLPERFGYLNCPAGIVRRLDVVDTARPADTLTGDKQRLFRKIWTIQVSSELTSPVDIAVFASTVNVTVTQT